MAPTTRLTLTQLDHLLAGRQQLLDSFAARRLAWPVVSAGALDAWPIETILAQEFRQAKVIGCSSRQKHHHKRKRASRPPSSSSAPSSGGGCENADLEQQLQHGSSSAVRVGMMASNARCELAEKQQRDLAAVDQMLDSPDCHPENPKGKCRTSLPTIEEEALRATMVGAPGTISEKGVVPMQQLQRDSLGGPQPEFEKATQEDGLASEENTGRPSNKPLLTAAESTRLTSMVRGVRKAPSKMSLANLCEVGPWERIACELCGRLAYRSRMARHHCHRQLGHHQGLTAPTALNPADTTHVSANKRNKGIQHGGLLDDKASHQPFDRVRGLDEKTGGVNGPPHQAEHRPSHQDEGKRDVEAGAVKVSRVQSENNREFDEDRRDAHGSLIQFQRTENAVRSEHRLICAELCAELEPQPIPDLPEDSGPAYRNGRVLQTAMEKPRYKQQRTGADPLEKVRCQECQRMIARARLQRHAWIHVATAAPGSVKKMTCPFCRAFYSKSRGSLASHVSRCHREEARIIRSNLPPRISWDILADAIEEEAMGQSQSQPQSPWVAEVIDRLPLQARQLLLPVTSFETDQLAAAEGSAPLAKPDTTGALVGGYPAGKLEDQWAESQSTSSATDEESVELEELDDMDDGLAVTVDTATTV